MFWCRTWRKKILKFGDINIMWIIITIKCVILTNFSMSDAPTRRRSAYQNVLLFSSQLNDGSTTAMGLQCCQWVSVGQRNEGDGQQKTPAHLLHSVCDLWNYGRSWRVVFKNVRLVWSGALFTRHLTSSCSATECVQFFSCLVIYVVGCFMLYFYTRTPTRLHVTSKGW